MLLNLPISDLPPFIRNLTLEERPHHLYVSHSNKNQSSSRSQKTCEGDNWKAGRNTVWIMFKCWVLHYHKSLSRNLVFSWMWWCLFSLMYEILPERKWLLIVIITDTLKHNHNWIRHYIIVEQSAEVNSSFHKQNGFVGHEKPMTALIGNLCGDWWSTMGFHRSLSTWSW